MLNSDMLRTISHGQERPGTPRDAQGRPGTPTSLAKKCFNIHYINAIFAIDRVVLALNCDKIKCSA